MLREDFIDNLKALGLMAIAAVVAISILYLIGSALGVPWYVTGTIIVVLSELVIVPAFLQMHSQILTEDVRNLEKDVVHHLDIIGRNLGAICDRLDKLDAQSGNSAERPDDMPEPPD